jgi:membrane protease YdiL (CAAX protease family)
MLLIVPFAIFLLGVLLYNRHVQNNSIRLLTTSRAKIDWRRVFFSFSVWGIFTVVSTLISFWLMPQDFVWNFKPIPFFIFLFLAVIFIPLQTSFEEYLFRAHLLQGLGLATQTRWVPLIVTSVLFGLMHAANPEVEKMGFIIMLYYIGTGLFLGILTLMDEGLELALGFHAANNLIGALLLTSDWSAFQTNSLFKDVSDPQVALQIVVPVVLIYPILLLIFSKKYKWKNWNQKLLGRLQTSENQ